MAKWKSPARHENRSTREGGGHLDRQIAFLIAAVTLGLLAGYFKGWVDELIQYIYTVLSSVPNVLLIAACVLMVQVFLDKNPDLFETGAERADLKLFLLCTVLGLSLIHL